MQETTDQTLLPPLPDPRALNGMRHGVLSELVPTWEREAYTAHAQAVRDSVGAGDYLQQRLADRAALALWRLDRLARWEAQGIEADGRRFADSLQGKQMDFGLSALEQRPVDARNLRDSLETLAQLTGESVPVLLRDPETAALYAQDRDREALAWAALLEGTDPATLSGEIVETLGVDLLAALVETWDVDPARLARLMLGRKATRQEAQDVADLDWTVEPQELAALVMEGARVAGDGWRRWLLEKQFRASGDAGKLRAVAARVPVLLEQERARAIEPDVKRLEKVARYEAHLERVLYRALHELEAMRRDNAPAPVRGAVELIGQGVE